MAVLLHNTGENKQTTCLPKKLCGCKTNLAVAMVTLHVVLVVGSDCLWKLSCLSDRVPSCSLREADHDAVMPRPSNELRDPILVQVM